jgi:hypothetical protein
MNHSAGAIVNTRPPFKQLRFDNIQIDTLIYDRAARSRHLLGALILILRSTMLQSAHRY